MTKSGMDDFVLVPAAAGSEAITVCTWEENGSIQHKVSRRIVVAWKVAELLAWPVLAGWIESDNERVLVRWPDGQMDDISTDCTYPDLDTAIEHIIADAKRANPKTREISAP